MTQVKFSLVKIPESGMPSDAQTLPLVAAEVVASYTDVYSDVGFQEPWIGYLALMDGKWVGTCGFKGSPKGDRVEIAYFTFPEYEGSGVATRMASELVRIAHANDPDLLVAAQTLPQEGPSTAILRKLGFERAGTVKHTEDGDVWEWHLEVR